MHLKPLLKCKPHYGAQACLKIDIVPVFISSHQEDIPIKCPNNHDCVPLTQCNIEDFGAFIYPCHKGLICCPSGSHHVNTTSLENRKTSSFPVECGLVLSSDKISGGKRAEFGQFPWMSLLGYKQRQVDFIEFLCGGSIITEQYVVTAAHCINLDPRLDLVVVRLGENDLSSEKDCVKLNGFESCADPHVDHPIDSTVIHPYYDNRNLHSDIALIKTRKRIKFTDFINPICLPFARNLDKKNLTGQKFTISGWGKTSANNVGGSTVLQFAPVIVWNQAVCAKSVPPDVQPITDSQLCANGPSTEDACMGDSGGPLVNATMDQGGDLRYFQIGIVSFASTRTCGNPSLPTVYTRVDRYLDWIEETLF